MGLGRAAIVGGAFSLGIFAACSHGIYDGSASAADAGASKTKVVDVAANTATTIVTDDRFFALQIPADAFTAPTQIRIEQLPDRTIEDDNRNTVIVPVYAVTSTAPLAPGKRVIVVLSTGNSFPGSQSPNQRLGVASLESSTPTVLAGGIATNQAEYFGLATKLGSFTIGYGRENGVPGNPSTPLDCFSGCCGITSAENRNCVSGKPFCTPRGGGGSPGGDGIKGSAGTTDFKCYFACTDLDVAVALCAAAADGGTQPPGGRADIQCGPPPGSDAGGAGTFCPGSGEQCCVIKSSSTYICDGRNCNANNGFTVNCTSKDTCPVGEECCVVGNQTQCQGGGCGGPARACTNTAHCSLPDTCTFTARCPFGVCGAGGGPQGCQ